jgi:TetR/AcrR family transcriptional regulator, tetracycline repressor protein
MPADRDKPIDRDRVVATALQLMDRIGLEKLTLRRIAAELDVQAPALYWHFRNKKELLDAMGTAVLAESVDGDPASWADLTWEQLVRTYGRGLRAALLKYRDGAKMAPGTLLTDPDIYLCQEAALRVFAAAGFAPETADTAMNTAYCFTVGFAIEEQAMYPRPDEPDPSYTPENRLSRIDPALAPTVAELAAADRKRASDDMFETGLTIVVAGIATLLPPTAERR